MTVHVTLVSPGFAALPSCTVSGVTVSSTVPALRSRNLTESTSPKTSPSLDVRALTAQSFVDPSAGMSASMPLRLRT